MEPVLLSRLGAEVVQFPVRANYAVVGHPVRELGLPREALLNVIVRGDRAIPPRGSTIVQAGDQLHLIVRQEVAVEFQDLLVAVADRAARGAQAPAAARAQSPGRDLGAPVGAGGRRPVAARPRSQASRSSTSCARAATSRARWWRSPTAVTPSPAGCSRSARPASCRPWPGGAWRAPNRPATGRGGRRSSAR